MCVQPLTASGPPTVSGLHARQTEIALSRSDDAEHHFWAALITATFELSDNVIRDSEAAQEKPRLV